MVYAELTSLFNINLSSVTFSAHSMNAKQFPSYTPIHIVIMRILREASGILKEGKCVVLILIVEECILLRLYTIKYDNHVTSLATIYFTCKYYTRLYIHNMFQLQCAIIR
jgi:hypothetical protein